VRVVVVLVVVAAVVVSRIDITDNQSYNSCITDQQRRLFPLHATKCLVQPCRVEASDQTTHTYIATTALHCTVVHVYGQVNWSSTPWSCRKRSDHRDIHVAISSVPNCSLSSAQDSSSFKHCKKFKI